MNTYYVEGFAGWFVCKALNARKAKSQGVEEYGRGGVRKVRRANLMEENRYKAERGEGAIYDGGS